MQFSIVSYVLCWAISYEVPFAIDRWLEMSFPNDAVMGDDSCFDEDCFDDLFIESNCFADTYHTDDTFDDIDGDELLSFRIIRRTRLKVRLGAQCCEG